MAKKLALVVHGIGEQQAGETLDALVGGLTGNTVCTVETETRMLREKNHDLPPNTPDRQAKLYPVHTRKVTTDTDEITFAEAYWADISRGPQGQVRSVYELILLVMGLGHIVRENAAEIYSNPKSPPRVMANLFVYLLHGPISVLNIVFALGVLALFGFQYAASRITLWLDPANFALLLVAVVLLIWWRIDRKDTHTYLYRIFTRWLFYVALLLLVLAGFTMFILPALPEQIQIALSKLMAPIVERTGHISENLDLWYISVLMLTIGAVWITLAVILVVLSGVEIIRRQSTLKVMNQVFENKDVKALYPQACVLMLTTWMAIVLILWIIGGQLISSITNTPVFEGIINTNILHVYLTQAAQMGGKLFYAFLAVGVSAALATRNRTAWIRKTPESEYSDTSIPKLIVHPYILVGLLVSLAFVIWGMAEIGVQQYQWYFYGQQIAADEGLPPQIVVFSTLIVTLFGFILSALSMGIGTAKDIVVYFVRRPPETVKEVKGVNVYPERARIQDRFENTLLSLIESDPPDEVVIVAHSQGTVVAVEALRGGRLHLAMQTRKMTPISPDLITMGSPTDQIFGFYFAKEFDLKSTEPSKDVTNGIAKWTNIFRVDDFVGTLVKGPNASFPTNKWVGKKGHTNYWVDDAVLTHMRDAAFPEFKP